jgi:hypothetical protein
MTRTAISGRSARGGYFVTATPVRSRGLSIPAPVAGWDAISPLAAMPETSAITLVNAFPQASYIEIRRGHGLHNDLDPVSNPVESLMAYHALDPANDKLFAAAGTAIYDVTATATATISAAHTGLTNARINHLNMATSGGNFLWCPNGADAPRYFDGSAWATASITGVTAANIISGTVFKSRIWLTVKGELSPAYLPLDSIQGAAAMFDTQGVFKKGGYLMAVGSWSLDAGDGPDDYLALVTSRGEVAIYNGTDPTSNFVLKGVYEMGAPIGRRCLTKVGADLAVICIDGVVPLSKALITDRAAAITIALTARIQPAVNEAARQYGANFGWQLIGYPRGTRAILNVPIVEGVQQEQYVMNTVTGAWCRFTRENANCWEIFKDRLFYGGNAGQIFEADSRDSDSDGSFEFDIETAFNYCGTRGQLKQFDMARALLTTDGRVLPGIALNVDFSQDVEVDQIAIEIDQAALWDVANWDAGTWPQVVSIQTDWVSVSGVGYCCSIRAKGTVEDTIGDIEGQPLVLQINGWDLLVKDGGQM